MLPANQWDAFLARHPNAHILQTTAWGELKAAFGWQPARLVAGDAGAQIIFRTLPLGLTFAYLPKGPVGENWDLLWPKIDQLCKEKRALFLKIEPDQWADEIRGGAAALPPPGFTASPHMVQPLRTITLDIGGDEEQILGRMKQKTRYNIRLARRKGIVVRPSDDLATFNQLMQITGERDQFGIHSAEYYQKAHTLFHPNSACQIFIAEFEETALAALMVFARGSRAWYFYGASSNEQRNRMPTYLLQWEAIRWARAQGCTTYDLWGVPDANQETLEAEFAARSDGLWGVYRFKRGFGGQLRRGAGPWDRVYNPLLYRLYLWWMSR